MLPSLAAHDIEKGLGSYIRNEFPIASSGFCDENGKTVIEKFLEAPGSLVKGPWVEVKMPFRSDSSASLPFNTSNSQKSKRASPLIGIREKLLKDSRETRRNPL